MEKWAIHIFSSLTTQTTMQQMLQGQEVADLCKQFMYRNYAASDHKWSFVCVLSSINVLHYDKWKDTDAVETMIYFLDAVITEFLEKLERYKNSKT